MPSARTRSASKIGRELSLEGLVLGGIPGVSRGDVRFGPVKRDAAAVGEGSMAIAFVHQYSSTLNTGRSVASLLGLAPGASAAHSCA